MLCTHPAPLQPAKLLQPRRDIVKKVVGQLPKLSSPHITLRLRSRALLVGNFDRMIIIPRFENVLGEPNKLADDFLLLSDDLYHHVELVDDVADVPLHLTLEEGQEGVRRRAVFIGFVLFRPPVDQLP